MGRNKFIKRKGVRGEMNIVVVTTGQRKLSFVRLEQNKFSIIDTRSNGQALHKTVSRKSLLKRIDKMT